MRALTRVAVTTTALTLVAGPVSSAKLRAPAAAAPRPNVLVILTDDQSVTQALRVMPATRRWFKRGGTTFRHAYVTTPLCCPSRASLFSGRYAHNHGVLDNDSAYRFDQSASVQRYLHDAGYLTGISGKILNGWRTEDTPPFFDRYAIYSPAQFSNGYRDPLFNLDGSVETVRGYSTDIVADRALEMLRWFEAQDDGRPWMLWVNPFAPHAPSRPAGRHQDARVPRYRPAPQSVERDRSDKPPYVRTTDTALPRERRVHHAQMRSLMAVDDLVGRLMRELGRLGERAGTLAFFLSDNGYTWGDHGWIDKRLPYTRSIKIPLFARWPGHLPAGTSRSDLVTNLDVPATIAVAAGATADPGAPLDGRSLVNGGPRDHVFLEYFANTEIGIPDWRSYRDHRVQYVEYRDAATGAVTFREYYDLAADPHQLRNLLGDADPANDPPAGEVARLSSAIARDARCVGGGGPDACP